MTISSTTSQVLLPANGLTTQFAFGNKIFQAADLIVTVIDNLGNNYLFTLSGVNTYTNGTLGISYTVFNIDVDAGCFIVFTAAITNGWSVDMRTVIAETQSTSIKNQGSFNPELHEEFFDKITREIQDLRRLTYTYGIHGPDIESTSWPALPVPTLRKGLGLVFDPVLGLPTVGTLISNALTVALIGSFLYPILGIEGATVVNIQYPYGVVDRYGTNTTPGVTDMTTAIKNAFLQQQQVGGAPVQLLAETYLITDTVIKTLTNNIPVVVQGVPNMSCLLNKAAANKPSIQLVDQKTFDIRGIVFAGRATFPNTGIECLRLAGGGGFGKIIDCVLNTNGIGIHLAGINDLLINTCKYWPNGFGAFPGAATNDGANALPGGIIADCQGPISATVTNCAAAATNVITVSGVVTGAIAVGNTVSVRANAGNYIPVTVTSIAGLPASFTVSAAVTIAGGTTVTTYTNPGQTNAVFIRDFQLGQCNGTGANPPGAGILIDGSANAAGPAGAQTGTQDWHIQDYDSGGAARSLWARNTIVSLFQNFYSGGEVRFDQNCAGDLLQSLYGNTVVVDGTQVLGGCERMTYIGCFANSITADSNNGISTHVNNDWFGGTGDADASIPKRIIGGRGAGQSRTTDLIGGNGLNIGPCGAIQLTGSSGAGLTITTAGSTVLRINPNGNCTAGILTKPVLPTATLDGCTIKVINLSAFTFTMAAVGTSFVADGALCVIPALRDMDFTFEASTNTWFHT